MPWIRARAVSLNELTGGDAIRNAGASRQAVLPPGTAGQVRSLEDQVLEVRVCESPPSPGRAKLGFWGLAATHSVAHGRPPHGHVREAALLHRAVTVCAVVAHTLSVAALFGGRMEGQLAVERSCGWYAATGGWWWRTGCGNGRLVWFRVEWSGGRSSSRWGDHRLTGSSGVAGWGHRAGLDVRALGWHART